MPPLTDPVIREQILTALEFRGFSGYVKWREQAQSELYSEGITEKLANEELYKFVRQGVPEDINALPERRPGFDSGMIYEFRFLISGKEAYVESRLEQDSDGEHYLWIVSFHWGWRK